MKTSIIVAIVFAALSSTSALAAQSSTKPEGVLCTKMFTKDGVKIDKSAEDKVFKSGKSDKAI
jgi:hypothetical protein